MPNVALYNIAGEEIGKVKLSEEIFGHEVNEAVLHTVVTAYLANQRQGTQSALTRAEVSGGGIKPWRQKGTGRARQGSTRSPVDSRRHRVCPQAQGLSCKRKQEGKARRHEERPLQQGKR